MLRNVKIDEPADHLLVLRAVTLRFPLEKLNAGLTQADGYLNLVFLEDELFRWRKRVAQDLHVPNRAFSVFDFLFHIFLCLSASNRRRRCESSSREL